MARFNVYDPLLSQDFGDEDDSERESEEKMEDIPPISEESIDRLTYRGGVQLLRGINVKTDQMKTLEDIKCFLRLRFFTNKEDSVVS